MSLVMDNEMLHDPAVVMTSKNPSLSSSGRSRPRYSAGMQILKTALGASNHIQSNDSTILPNTVPTQTAGGRTKPSRRTPRKKRANKGSPQQQNSTIVGEQIMVSETQQIQLQATMLTQDAGQENRSPNKKRRIFKPSNKQQQQHSSPKTPHNNSSNGQNRTPLVNTTNQEIIQRLQHFSKASSAPTFTSAVTPYRRFPVAQQMSSVFTQTRYGEQVNSDLNPFARSFVPRYVNQKPGVSNEYVSREISEYYQRNRQTNEQFKSKQIMRQGLEGILKHGFPHHVVNLYMVGSSTNGIGDNGSTVDICIIARKRPTIATTFPMIEAKPESVTNTATSTTNDSELEVQSSAGQPLALSQPTSPNASLNASNMSNVTAASDISVETDTEQKQAEKTEAAQEALEGLSLGEKHDAAKEAQVVEMADTEKASQEEVKPIAHVDVAPVPELTLEMIEKFLQSKNFAKDIVSIPAKVPIIKFKDDITKLSITLNLNQEVSIRNTQLIRDYAKLDWRFPYLAMVMKRWAQENHINNAMEKTISNYSWTLMVVHFLQVCDPPVLPCLHKLIPRRYNHGNIEQAIHNWRRYPAKWRSNNNMNLRQLLKAMFRYYGYVFSYDQHVISVREGRVLDRSDGFAVNEDHHSQWNAFLCIEEPFTRTNTARSVHDKEKFERIIELFRMSSNALRGVRISLFNVIADDINCPITY